VIRNATALRGTILAAIIGLGASGCATPVAMPVDPLIRQGVVEQVTEVALQSPQHVGVGAVVGGLGGLGIGSLIGGGGGRDVAMLLGAIGGGMLGNQIQQSNTPPLAGQQVIVRTSSGVLVSIVQPFVEGLYAGRHVYVEGSGQMARVLPQTL
jgi:outer membrane lipoprotein SlyB